MSGPDLDRHGPSKQVLHYILRTFDAAEAYDGNPDRPRSLVNQPHCYRLYGGSGQSPSRTTEFRLTSVCIQTQCGVCVRNREGVGTSFLRRLGENFNPSNTWSELDPQRAACRFAYGRDYGGGRGGVGAEFRPAPFDVGAGYVELISGEPLGVFQNPDDLHVIRNRVPENVCDYRGAVRAQQGQLLGYKRPDADVLQADRVHDPGGGFAKPGAGGAIHGARRKPLYDQTAQAIQVHESCELDPIPKGAAGSDDGIRKTKGSEVDGQVNPAGPPRRRFPHRRVHWRKSSMPVKSRTSGQQ